MKNKIKLDKEEKIRKWINMQFVIVKRFTPVINTGLLVVLNSLTLYYYIEHREIHPYIAVPIIALSLGAGIWLISVIYYRVALMHRGEKFAEIFFDPYQVSHFRPFEEILYRYMWLRIMGCQSALLSDDEAIREEAKQKMDESIKLFTKWIELGYIPKEDYPKHLLHFYKTSVERRL